MNFLEADLLTKKNLTFSNAPKLKAGQGTLACWKSFDWTLVASTLVEV